MNKNIDVLHCLEALHLETENEFFNFKDAYKRYGIESSVVLVDISHIENETINIEKLKKTFRPFDKVYIAQNIALFVLFHCKKEDAYAAVQKKIFSLPVHPSKEYAFVISSISKKVDQSQDFKGFIRKLIIELVYEDDLSD